MSPQPRKSPRIKSTGLHQCPQCDKGYERPDHLARHLDSHRNERMFQCPVCLRGFNRRDVLQRHQGIHSEGKSVNKFGGRAIEACEDCAVAKVSCDNDRPCKRCRNKGISCTPRRHRGNRDKVVPTPPADHKTPQGRFQSEMLENDASSSATGVISEVQDLSQTPLVFPERSNGYYLPNSPDSPSIVLHAHHSDRVVSTTQLEVQHGMYEYPAFFEQVMAMPGLSSSGEMQAVQQPRGVFDFMSDSEFTGLEGGLFGNDIILDLDRILETGFSPAGASPYSESNGEDQTARQRVAAFRRSLWQWVPEKNQNGFSGEDQMPLGDGDVTASISSLHRSRLDALNIRGKLTNQLRDDIFQLVIRTVGSRLTVPSFPTTESLDTLIKIGIAKRTETDAWIHPYTLYRERSRPELLTALVAAGCVCCGISSINKTGVLLLEIVRESLAKLVEADNSVLRELQYFQASMMWLDIGAFCGYKRKMQIAESHLQPLCTALRRAGAFDRSFYSQIIPMQSFGDEDSLEAEWYEWIQQESLKRLAYHLFEHDVEVAAAMNRPPLTSYAELTLPFPRPRELWLAPTAAAWKNMWVEKYSHTVASDLSLRDLLSDPSMLNSLPHDVDIGVVRSAMLHGLTSQVLEFRQQALLSDNRNVEGRAMTRLWLQSRQDDLLCTIRDTKKEISDSPAIAILFSEFSMMYLHTNLDSIKRFAGQFGESEARKEYPRLRDWSFTKEARTSIWHAGQVLRAARQVPPFQLRGFDSLAIYHATLTLWVFGLLQCGERQREGEDSLTGTHSQPYVNLDGPKNEFTKVFISRAIGQPGLTFYTGGSSTDGTPTFCQLRSPRLVMDVGRQVFEDNLPGAGDSLPPLVDNLRNLMRDLGNLP